MPRRTASPPLALAALLLAILVACRPAPDDEPASLFPLELGRRWVYETTFYGPNGSTTDTTVAVCRIREDEDVGRVYLVSTCAQDELVLGQLFFLNGREVVEPIVVNREGETRPRDPPEVMMRLDLRVGQSWSWEGRVGDDERRALYRAANRGRVFTPAGEFEAVRLLVTSGMGGPPAALERWYAPGVGMVKEAGATLLPTEGGHFGLIELVRTLKQHDVRPVDSIPCCGRVPRGVGGG